MTIDVPKTNVRNVSEGRIAASLRYVFAQLTLFNAKTQALRDREPQYHMRLTPYEKRQVRRQLRRDLRASLEMLEKAEK